MIETSKVCQFTGPNNERYLAKGGLKDMGCRVQAWDDTLLLNMSFCRWILMKQIIQSQFPE
jgi:hypothetical protein